MEASKEFSCNKCIAGMLDFRIVPWFIVSVDKINFGIVSNLFSSEYLTYLEIIVDLWSGQFLNDYIYCKNIINLTYQSIYIFDEVLDLRDFSIIIPSISMNIVKTYL